MSSKKSNMGSFISNYLAESGWKRTETANNFPNMVEYENNIAGRTLTIGYEYEHIIVWLEENDGEFQFSIKPESMEQAKEIIDISKNISKINLHLSIEQLSDLSEVYINEED